MPHPGSKKAKAAKARRRQQRATKDSAADRARAEARLERQIESRRRRERTARWRKVRTIGVTVLAVVLLGVGVWTVFRPDPELAGVTRPPNRGGGHISSATYDSATPTSGAHSARAPACSVYRQPLEPSLAVHGLEHGAVVLWYDADRPELADELVTSTAAFDSHVIISPNGGLTDPIVATAWNRLKAYEPGDPEIGEFVDTYRRRGPERVACDR